jgi:hypothetical protein
MAAAIPLSPKSASFSIQNGCGADESVVHARLKQNMAQQL